MVTKCSLLRHSWVLNWLTLTFADRLRWPTPLCSLSTAIFGDQEFGPLPNSSYKAIQYLHFAATTLWVWMLDSHISWCSPNRHSRSMVPTKDSRRSLVWFCEEWPDSPDHPVTSTFCDCQVPPTLSIFGHICRMETTPDYSWIIFKQPPENWRRPPGHACSTWIRNFSDDLSSFNMELTGARDAAQNWLVWRMLAKHGATHL